VARCRHGFRLDHFERKRKKEARAPHELAQFEKKAFGLKAKLHHKKRHQEKVLIRDCALDRGRSRDKAVCGIKT
jgi:ribosome biogenesis protein NSA2